MKVTRPEGSNGARFRAITRCSIPARALLYQAGFRERSHFCLIVALRELYVSRRKVDLRFVEALQLGKSLRENADYYGRFSGEGAGKMLADARAFLRAARALLSAGP